MAPRDKNTKTLRKNKKHIAIHKNTLKRSRETVNIKKQGFYIFFKYMFEINWEIFEVDYINGAQILFSEK